jgi:cyclophilin family peptidyl-prolyl cis-trans isomerase/HEAT repeat protein
MKNKLEDQPKKGFFNQYIISCSVCITLLLGACVPVEEKVEIPFDASINLSKIQHTFDLQNAQQSDSLITLLSSEDPSLRYAAARAFASFQDTSALQAVLPLLLDKQGEVRMMAALAIGQLGVSAAQTPLTDAFDGRDSARLYEKANSQILEAMGKIGDKPFLRALSTISTYQAIDTLLLLGQARGIYRYALREIIDEEGTNTMVRYLANPAIPLSVRIVAANYLQRAKDLNLEPHADQIIASWHGESHPFLRMCLATALGKVKSKEAMKELMLSLGTESDYRVKCSILRALQQFNYADVYTVILNATKDENPNVAEVAAQYFIGQGQEKDALKYKSAIHSASAWQAKTRLAQAANMNLTSMFTGSKITLQNEILASLEKEKDPYQKAAWLKAWGSEIRNFESLPKYFDVKQPIPVRTQAVTSLIDVCVDKNFDTYFAGEGYLIKAQIVTYLTDALKTGDAGIAALIAEAILNPDSGLKNLFKDKKTELSKALAGLKLPDEMETYMEVSRALKEYGVESLAIPEEQKNIRTINWRIIGALQKGSTAEIATSKGSITLALYPDRAPASVSSFVQLAQDGYYNGKAFHRVVPNFVIQTGCPRGDGFGGLDFTLRSELAGTYYDDEGYVGMASAGLHTEGPQFFITHSPTPHLDGRYTIIGKVISGMDIVHRISIGDTISQINIRY